MCLGIPGELIEIYPTASSLATGVVNFGGVQKKINLAFVPDVKIGDYVIVHVGFAISIIDKVEALKRLTILDQLYGPEENK